MRFKFQSRGQIYELSLERQGEAYQAVIDGMPYDFELLEVGAGQVTLRIEDRPVTLYWAVEGGRKWLSVNGCTYLLEKPAPRSAQDTASSNGAEAVRAPMPAQVRLVQVAEGDAVEKGQTLLLLEAMKMEIRIKAPAAGTVKRLLAAAGQTVEKDQVLAEIGA